MDLAAFRASLTDAAPPAGLSHALKALWLDATGDWDAAHDAAQADDGGAGDWVHAYLHRKESRLRYRASCRSSAAAITSHSSSSEVRQTGLPARRYQ
jgi:hypothetical protein